MCGAEGRCTGLTCLGVSLVMALGVFLWPGSSSLADHIASENHLRIMTYNNPPFATEVAGVKQGMLIELLDELFRRAGMSYELQFLPLKRAMMMAEHGKDVCVLPLERSQERESQYSWVGPILISRYGLFSGRHQQVPLVVLEDARPYKIGSYLGSGVGEYLQEMGFEVEFTVDNSQNLKKLVRNRIDLWATELISATADMQRLGVELGAAELVFFTSIRAMACHPDLPLAQKAALENALRQLYREGFIDTLNRGYAPQERHADPGQGWPK
jgi:polar amino acid transport system substrate-binding protein